MEKVNETAIKGRQTKLSKKSQEELINIILRKDKTERTNAETIKGLKAEVNELNERNARLTKNVREEASRCIGLKKDMDGQVRITADYKAKYNKALADITALNQKVSAYKKLTIGLSVLVLVVIVLGFIF